MAVLQSLRIVCPSMTAFDAIMQAKYARNPDKLRGWQSASHLERAPVRAKKTPSPAQPPK